MHDPRLRIDTGLWALAHVARLLNLPLDVQATSHQLAIRGRPATVSDLVTAARNGNLKCKVITAKGPETLLRLPRPLIFDLSDGRFGVLLRGENGRDLVMFARSVRPTPLDHEKFRKTLGGRAILIAESPRPAENITGLGWFATTTLRYYRPLLQVLGISLFIQAFSLATPLLFQVIVDKVLVHRSVATLEVVAGAMVLLAVFDTALQFIRTYSLAHTSNRLDVDLGMKVFEHFLRLPVSYFDSRPAGQTVARIREVENIRAFLAGQGPSLIADSLFALIYIAVLFMYSPLLALVSIGFFPLYGGIVALIRPILRRQIKEKFSRGAVSQQRLVESVIGASTLKSLAVEPAIQRQWEFSLAAYVHAAFQAQLSGNAGQTGITLLTRLSTITILCLGAYEVMADHLTVGGLIAFNMISAQMISPIIRLSNLWQDLQQVQISADRVGDILKTDPEPRGRIRPGRKIEGAIEFANVSFSYPTREHKALDQVSFHIRPGSSVGIIGQSGSGKSTITRLIQAMYLAESGLVRVDGHDIRELDTVWLRKQMGIVLQDNFLLSRSVHENIALTAPELDRGQVVKLAKLAGADDFINELPMGYDTLIEERGANLSGGQKQRIAIARALARDPRILIFDEATSALDIESERIIQDNMGTISMGRTVVVVAHRLTAVETCDHIISLSQGKILEQGSKDELRQSGGLFSTLSAIRH